MQRRQKLKLAQTPVQSILDLPDVVLLLVFSFYEYAEDGWRQPRARGEAYNDIRDHSRHARRTGVWLLHRHWYSTIRVVHPRWSTLFPQDFTCFLTWENLGDGASLPPESMLKNAKCLVVDESLMNDETALTVASLTKNVQFMKVNNIGMIPFSWLPNTIGALAQYTQLRELSLNDGWAMTTDEFNAIAQLTSLTHLKTPACEPRMGDNGMSSDNGMSILVATLSKLVFLELTGLKAPFSVPFPGLPKLKRLILWPHFDAPIEDLRFLPVLEQLTLRNLKGFEGEIEQIAGIRTLPKELHVFIDIHLSLEWFSHTSECPDVISGWYEAYVQHLYELLEFLDSQGSTKTDVVIEYVNDVLRLWTKRGALSLANKKEYQRLLRVDGE